MKTKNIIFSITLILLFISQNSFGQKVSPANQLEHTKAVYENTEDGNLYWPSDLPVYIRLSPSAKDGSPSFLLDNLNINGKFEENKEGIKIEMSGNQYVRWINAVTMGETKFRFFADGEPPVISHKFNDAPKYVSKGITYFGQKLNCTYSAKDEYSGVKDILLSIDGKPYSVNTAPVDYTTEKDFFVQYYSVDKVGYFNKPTTVEFTVDLTAPQTASSVENNFIDNILSSQTKIVLSSEDNSSGVKKTYYKFDNNSSFSIYVGKINIQSLSNGNHIISYYSVDNVENKEELKKYEFYYDKEAPKPSITIRGAIHKEGSTEFVSAQSLITFSATDDKSQVKNIKYSINTNNNYTTYENPFPISLQTGPFSITYYSEDKLGNKSKNKIKKYQMDLVPPVTKYKMSGDFYAQNTTIWINKDTKINLKSTDTYAGVKEILYVVGDEQPATYTTDFQVAKEGNFLCRYWAVDNVNNREGDNILLFITDNAAPEIKEIFSVSPLETGDDGIDVYSQYTNLFLAATDMSSGLKTVTYSINGSTFKEYKTAIIMNKEGSYTIKIKAVDNLKQQSEKEIKFKIRKLTTSDFNDK